MPTIYQHAAARHDLVEQFVYLAEEAGLDMAGVIVKSGVQRYESSGDLVWLCCLDSIHPRVMIHW